MSLVSKKSLIILLFVLISASALAYAKPRVAVITFDNRSGWWVGHLDDVAPNMLVTQLVKSGKFSVMERDRLNEIMREQNLGVSGNVTPETAARIGKLLGVEFLITGTVTKFSMENKKASFIVGSATKTVAEATLHVRAFNTTTGEIVFTDEASSNKTFSKVYVMGAGGGVDFDRGLAEDILDGAIKDLAKKIIASDRFSGAGSGLSRPSGHMVAKISDNKVYINAGSNKGVNVGDTFKVKRNVEEIIDPETGQSLGSVTDDVGTIKVIQVMDNMAVCEIISGGPFRQKDIVE